MNAKTLTPALLRKLDAYWRAANYLSAGQIYLYDNPLLKQPLKLAHIKPRLLGHWGTTPGLNFVCVHLNRVIKEHILNVMYITGPGHGGPGLVANAYLEGTCSEVYPNIAQDEAGMTRLKEIGVDHRFGVPGDFVLGFFNQDGGLPLARLDSSPEDRLALVFSPEHETSRMQVIFAGRRILDPALDDQALRLSFCSIGRLAGPQGVGLAAEIHLSHNSRYRMCRPGRWLSLAWKISCARD